MERIKDYLNNEEFGTSGYTLYELLMKLCDDKKYQAEVLNKLKKYSVNLSNRSGVTLKQYKFDYFVDNIKKVLSNASKYNETLFDKFSKKGVFDNMKKKKANKFKKIINKIRTEKIYFKIERIIKKLDIKKQLKNELIDLLDEDDVYVFTPYNKNSYINMNVFKLPFEEQCVYDRLMPKFIFSSICSAEAIDEYGDDGVTAMFILAIDWSCFESKIKQLKELVMLDMAEQINNLGFSKEGNELLSCLPIDIVGNPIFRKNLSKKIQISLFNEYDSGEYITKYKIYKNKSNQIKHRMHSIHYYIIFDNVYYITHINKLSKRKNVIYDDNLNILAIEYDDDDNDDE